MGGNAALLPELGWALVPSLVLLLCHTAFAAWGGGQAGECRRFLFLQDSEIQMDLTDLCGNTTGRDNPRWLFCSGCFAVTSSEAQLPTFFSFFFQRMALIRKTTKK